MQTRIEAKTARYRFDSLRELGTFARDAARTWQETTSTDPSYSRDWDLGASYKDAVNMARDGWLEGAERAQRALNAFLPTKVEPETVTDFYGYRPHVARFCAGAPDSMIRKAYAGESGGGAVLTLIVPIAANAGNKAACMANFGVAVAQYVSQLETQGTRVELLACINANIRGMRVTFAWTVKNADQPLDLAVVAFSIGHPAMLRRLGLALIERSAARETPGYGQAQDCQLSDIINAPEGAIILNGMKDANLNAPTPEKGLAFVEQRIQKLMEQAQ